MSDDKLTPAEEREGIVRVLTLAAASGSGAGIGANVCQRIVELLTEAYPVQESNEPPATREVVAMGLRRLAVQDRGAFFSSTSLRTIATLLEAPCAEEVAAAKLALYSTIMGEIADEMKVGFVGKEGVLIRIERGTYDTLMKNRTEPTT